MQRQHGVVARGQLLELGYASKAIDRRLATGRLHRIHAGVYAVGRPQIDHLGRWTAAVLASGPEAVLSHASAGALWGLRPPAGGPVSISRRPGTSQRPQPGIVLHCQKLPREDISIHRGIKVTSPALTILNLAAQLSPDLLERAIADADRLDLITPPGLTLSLPRFAQRPGVATLRKVLEPYGFVVTDSILEQHLLPIAQRVGLPAPETQQWVNGFRVDFHWPKFKLIVETDGLRYHRTAAQQTKDRLRDQAHLAAGYTPLRFTRFQVVRDPDHVERILRAVAGR